MDIRVPQLAEGADSGTVVNLLVSEGQTIRKGDTLLELENQKAVAPIPSTADGKVTRIHVKVGDNVSVGQVLVTLSSEGAAAPSARQPAARPQPAGTQEGRAAAGTSKAGTPAAGAPEADYTYASPSGAPPPASPSVRKLAQQVGLDLRKVKGSETGGRITLDDVRAYVARLQQAAAASQPSAPQKPAPAKLDLSKWGPVTRKPMSGLRKAISRAMTDSWSAIPHVTQFGAADPARVLQLVKKHLAAYEKKGAKLTLTGILIKALVITLKKYPVFNGSLDEASEELVFKDYIHMGIAVDTEQGLIVPVLRDADKKNLLKVSKELADLAERTRKRKLSSEELQGASFTISNQGGIGGAHFTPIIHRPEVAILGVGRAEGALPLSLSYDHRVIDGADAARFITELARVIEDFPEAEVSLGAR